MWIAGGLLGWWMLSVSRVTTFLVWGVTLILGAWSLRRGLVLSDGSLTPFFTRPICMVLAAITIFMFLLYVPPFRRAVGGIWKSVTRGAQGALGRSDG